VAALSAVLVCWPAVVRAQADDPGGTVVGALVGMTDNRQLWRSDAIATRGVQGAIVGAFADVAAGAPWLRVRAEGAYTQRGGDVSFIQDDDIAVGGVREHLLTIGVHVGLVRRVGPLRVHVAGGPTLDQVLSSHLDPVLAQVLEEESTVIFGVSVGGGVGAWVSPGLFLGGDVRLTENLGDAYSGNFTSFRNRSVEYRLVAGVPLSRLRAR
jgi:hypothetical protein